MDLGRAGTWEPPSRLPAPAAPFSLFTFPLSPSLCLGELILPKLHGCLLFSRLIDLNLAVQGATDWGATGTGGTPSPSSTNSPAGPCTGALCAESLSCPAPALSLRSPHHLQAAALGLVSAEPGAAPRAAAKSSLFTATKPPSHPSTGYKKTEGAFVHAGNTLATQRIICWQPGAHVGMGCNKSLYALENGTVRFTKEVYVPPPRSQESREVICPLPKGVVLYKTFINIVPTKEVRSFKLVTML
uniref:Large ribosomal subunit protein bL27m n=1 Tax=Chelonoidis abingdonii TaxID=106734 RepID=A0A8C0HE02_CHEAB